MRILLISNLFPPEFIGGYELIANELATRFAAVGHKVVVATSPLVNHDRDQDGQPFTIHRTLRASLLELDKSNPEWNELRSGFIWLANVEALRRIVEDFRPDRILLCNLNAMGALGIIVFLHQIGYCPGIYLGDNIFVSAKHDPQKIIEFSRLFRLEPALRSLRVFAVSQRVIEDVQDTLATPIQCKLFVPGWVPENLPALTPRPDGDLTRFVFSSRVAEHKGIWILLDAVKLAVACGDDNFVVDVYGAGQGPELIQRAHAAGLSKYIRYIGTVGREEMMARFAGYDALLFPTWRREPLGLVPFEAAAQGCIPVITAQTGASEWLLADDCIKIERTPEGLAGGMQRVLYMTREKRVAMRQSLSDMVRKSFSASHWFPQIEREVLALPEPIHQANLKIVQDAMFAIARMWKG